MLAHSTSEPRRNRALGNPQMRRKMLLLPPFLDHRGPQLPHEIGRRLHGLLQLHPRQLSTSRAVHLSWW